MDKKLVSVYNTSDNELPCYAKYGDAGFDIRADFKGKEKTEDFIGEDFRFDSEKNEITLLARGGRVLIPSGLHIKLPLGYELQIRPRSGLALKHGISMVNTPGTIDSMYLGNVGLIVINTGKYDFIIQDGDRMGQGVLNKVEQVEWVPVSTKEELGTTERGDSGYGQSGIK